MLNTYGPAVDSSSAQAAADLWTEGGIYDAGGVTRFMPEGLIAMYGDTGRQHLVHTGVSHLTATPRIELEGDCAQALAYSYVVLRRGEEWFIMRGAINHWSWCALRTGGASWSGAIECWMARKSPTR